MAAVFCKHNEAAVSPLGGGLERENSRGCVRAGEWGDAGNAFCSMPLALTAPSCCWLVSGLQTLLGYPVFCAHTPVFTHALSTSLSRHIRTHANLSPLRHHHTSAYLFTCSICLLTCTPYNPILGLFIHFLLFRGENFSLLGNCGRDSATTFPSVLPVNTSSTHAQSLNGPTNPFPLSCLTLPALPGLKLP